MIFFLNLSYAIHQGRCSPRRLQMNTTGLSPDTGLSPYNPIPCPCVDQTPKVPQDGLFLVQEYSGILQLVLQSLRKWDTPQYNLTVEVSDKG